MGKIFINSLGLCCSLGNSFQEVSEALLSKNPQPNIKPQPLVSGKQTPFYFVDDSSDACSLSNEFNSRNNRLSKISADQISSDVHRLIKKFGSDRISVILGTSTSGINSYEDELLNKNNEGLSNYNYSLQEISNTSSFVSSYFSLNGLSLTVSTACSSGAKAVIEGCRLIEAGLADACIVGGTDSFSQLTLNGFDSLEAIDTNKTNPFSRNRRGINIGEASALFIISREPAEIYIAGYGESSDGYHISAPDPTGHGPQLALEQALTMASIEPCEIGYINLHGTGTKKNDAMEAELVNNLFDDVLVSTTKPFTGHTLGAAGAIELAFSYISLSSSNESRSLPVHIWDNVVDNDMPVLNFTNESSRLATNYIMSNSFAFGGNNASLIIARTV